MSRRRVAAKQAILPDPKFGSDILAKFINVLMVSGKKSVAEKIVYEALDEMQRRMKKQGGQKHESKKDSNDYRGMKSSEIPQVSLFQEVLDKIRPTVEVRSRRVGGATYQIPMEVSTNRGIALAMRWLVQSARQRNEQGMMQRLASEMMEALEGKGSALKKREDTHRMAKANQAFAHFRWN